MPEYTLTPEEQRVAMGMQNRLLKAKANLHDLDASLVNAEKEVRSAQHEWEGMLRFLALSHGIENVRLSDDFTKITNVEIK